jgi:hypothetical protein
MSISEDFYRQALFGPFGTFNTEAHLNGTCSKFCISIVECDFNGRKDVYCSLTASFCNFRWYLCCQTVENHVDMGRFFVSTFIFGVN